MAHARRRVTVFSRGRSRSRVGRARSPKATARLLPASGFQPTWGLRSFFRGWAFGTGRRKYRRLR
jgi:hypothetical protein